LSNKIGAVVAGGDFQGLGVLRTLAEKKIPIILLDHEFCISRYSRYKKKFFKSPNPFYVEVYVNFLIQLAEKEGIQGWILFPNNDQTVYVLSQYKEILEKYYRIPTPPWDVIQYVYIKRKTYEIAEKHGIPIPKLYDVKNLEQLLEADPQYPLVIKPSIRDHLFTKLKKKAFRINNRDELVKTYKKVHDIIDSAEILAQDLIPGGPKNLYSYCPFFKNGKVIAGIAGRRARQHPWEFGHASTFVELVDIPEIKSIAEKFLSVIDYSGIAEVEFMLDPRDNRYKLLEVNPRVWGWHTLAIAAGIDMPNILYHDMLGEEFEVPNSLSALKWIRLITDIPTALIEIIKGNIGIRDYVASLKGIDRFAVFSLKDPLPFFVEIALLPYLWRKRGI